MLQLSFSSVLPFFSISVSFDVEKSSNGTKRKKVDMGLAPNLKLGLSLVFFLFAPFELLLVCCHKEKLRWSKKMPNWGWFQIQNHAQVRLFSFLLHLSFFPCKKKLGWSRKKSQVGVWFQIWSWAQAWLFVFCSIQASFNTKRS